MNKECIICDLDGVIFEYLDMGLEEFYKNLDVFCPKNDIIPIIQGLYSQGIKIIFLTARSEKCRRMTRYQLDSIINFPYELCMRDRDDIREDYIIKEEITKELMVKYHVLLAIDDNPKNCQMFKSLGITTLQVL